MYDELDKNLASNAISKTEYDEQKRHLDSKIAEKVNNAAWNKHYLAESERKSDGVPTPDQPVALAAGQVGGNYIAGAISSGGISSFYRPSYQNYGAVTGMMGGSAGMGSIRAATDQNAVNARTVSNDARSSSGTYLSAPPPGSVYDDDEQQR
jgi:hypothetical protein